MPHQTATLHVTQLDDRVTETMLKEIFSMISPVNNVDIDTQQRSGLVQFNERTGAEQALHAMDGRIILGQKIHIEWAKQVKQQHYYTLLINGLTPTVTPDLLKKAFADYSPRHVEVLLDPTSPQSRYYGLIDFEHQHQAERALIEMHGHSIGSCDLHCSWANPQLLKSIATTGSAPTMGSNTPPAATTPTSQFSRPATPQTPSFMPTHPSTACRVTTNNMSYEEIFAQTPPYNTTVSVKNLPDEITEQDLIPHFQQYGYVSHITLTPDHDATIKLDTHANASTAIFALQGFDLDGRAMQLSWGTHEIDNEHPAMNYATPSSTLPAASLNAPNTSASATTNPANTSDIVQPQTNAAAYFDMLTHRPPAPVAGSPHSAGGKAGQAIHGWNQYYQTYYSAGHQSII
ncbi:hypothetical protein [Absidia glauca]|uniref:RRM domain-containing protein n=1 Tax=Absidia glauca TaxID=4829 RepID=A0A168KW29_ABSGL|nr:hypothetical protein [Absidia glauca]